MALNGSYATFRPNKHGVGLKVLAGAGAQIDTTKAGHQILWAFFLSKLEIRLECILIRI